MTVHSESRSASSPMTRTDSGLRDWFVTVSEAIADKDAARDRAIAAFRPIVSRIRADHRIPDTVKLALGINPPPRGPKPRVAAPTTTPHLWIVEAHPGRVIMRYADSATPDSRSKPRGVQQLQLFVAIGPERISDPEQAKYLAAYTRTPFEVPLRDEDDGLMATYFGRWSTRTALVGPWSEPVSMTVIGSGQGRPIRAQPETEGEGPVIEVKRATHTQTPSCDEDSASRENRGTGMHSDATEGA